MADNTSFSISYCEQILRERDKDRYLSTLYMPLSVRHSVFALYAFNSEISHIRETITNPMLGEIRLQWWYDQIAKGEEADRQSHPILQALFSVIESSSLSKEPLLSLIEARSFDLYDEPMESVGHLLTYYENTTTELFLLSAQVITGASISLTSEFNKAAYHAGIAYGITETLRAFSWHTRRGQQYLPKDIQVRHNIDKADMMCGKSVEQVRAALSELAEISQQHLKELLVLMKPLTEGERRTLLSLCLIPSYLALTGKKSFDPFQTRLELPFWEKHWLLWRAHSNASKK